jgi:O-antigen/teichoic acid export membrane protein
VRLTRSVASLLSDATLTKKALLNSFASFLDYGARLLVVFLLTPIMVSSLGGFGFGMWQIVTRSVGYLTPASGRPTEALKWSLANRQRSSDYDEKRLYVGSTLVVWLLFLPPTLLLGAALAWFVPLWFDAPPEFLWATRLAVAFLVVDLVLGGLTAIPHSVLQGENLGYKRMGLSTTLVLVGGLLTWGALHFGLGLAGMAGAAVASTVLAGVFFFALVRKYAPWFGIRLPSVRDTRRFLGLSVWFLIWNLVMRLMMSSDVLVLGFFDSVDIVGDYIITKYALETAVVMIAMIVFGITPGLGGIIGAGDRPKAAAVRAEVMALTWLFTTALCTTVLLWNRVFVGLWVGEQHYLGALPSLLIALAVTQLVLIRNDSNIIDLTLNLRAKVLLGLASSLLAVGIAAVAIRSFDAGVVGLTLGLIIGRSVLSMAYPAMIGRYLGVRGLSQIVALLRPGALTALLFAAAFVIDSSEYLAEAPLVRTWPGFLAAGALTFTGLLGALYFAGFTRAQRDNATRRVRALVSRPPRAAT